MRVHLKAASIVDVLEGNAVSVMALAQVDYKWQLQRLCATFLLNSLESNILCFWAKKIPYIVICKPDITNIGGMDSVFYFYCDSWYFTMPAFNSFTVYLSVIFPVTEQRHHVFDHFDQVVAIRPGYFGDRKSEVLFSTSLCMRPCDDDRHFYRAFQRLRRPVLFEDCAPSSFGDSSCFMEVASRFVLPSFLHSRFWGYEFMKELYFHF